MPNFQQCNRCKLTLPMQYLTTVSARNKSGRVKPVRVCNACIAIIIKEQSEAK